MDYSLKKPDAIFFDWDGTLVETQDFLESAHNHALELLNLPPRPSGWFYFYFGKPRDFIYSKIYGEQGHEAQSLFEDFFIKNHCSHVLPSAGAEILLNTAHTAGITMGVVSNKKNDFVSKELSHLKWEHFFKVIIGGGDASNDKPSSAPLFMAYEHLDLNPEDNKIWYVGDTQVDYQAANGATGTTSIILSKGKDLSWACSQKKPDLTFGNCDELKDFLLHCE